MDIIDKCKLRIGNKNNGGFIVLNLDLNYVEYIYSIDYNSDVYFELDFI